MLYLVDMERVILRIYKYKYTRDGIVPGTWYDDYLLDPCSVHIEHYPNSERTTISGIVTDWIDQDGKECMSIISKRDRPWSFSLIKYNPIPEQNYVRKDFETLTAEEILYPYYSVLVIDGTEYMKQYVDDHPAEMTVLLGRIRTDTLLEEIAGDD